MYENGSLKYILNDEGKLNVGDGSNTYQFFVKDHLGNTRLSVRENGVVEEVNHYYPFGMRMNMAITKSDADQKYLYNGKELQQETDWYDFHARFYDPAIVRTTTVDPMAESFYGESPYSFMGNNPILNTDPTGMFYDWFQNEITGDVYYHSEMRKGDEGTGAMKGEGWVHMGENGMFSNGSPLTSDASVLFGNQGLGEISMTSNYDKPQVFADSKVTSVTMTGMFKGDNAKKLMGNLGYDFKPVLFKYHSDVTTEYHPEVNGQVTISHDNSRVESVLSSRYISQDLVLKKTLTLGTYQNPQYDPPKWYGPMYSIRDQSWTVQKNVYGMHAFGRKFGKTVNTLQKILPWKGAYENLWKKALK